MMVHDFKTTCSVYSVDRAHSSRTVMRVPLGGTVKIIVIPAVIKQREGFICFITHPKLSESTYVLSVFIVLCLHALVFKIKASGQGQLLGLEYHIVDQWIFNAACQRGVSSE